jgi:hypothetical protein
MVLWEWYSRDCWLPLGASWLSTQPQTPLVILLSMHHHLPPPTPIVVGVAAIVEWFVCLLFE